MNEKMSQKNKNSVWRFINRIGYWNHFFIVVLIGLIYLFVYYTGGIKYVYSHTMYIPIVYAGLVLGKKWGVIVGILAGIVIGPFMPIDTLTGEMQSIENWIFRLLIFTMVGGVSGLIEDSVRSNIVTIRDLLTRDIETRIPNLNSIVGEKVTLLLEQEPTLVSVLVSNYDHVIDMLGTQDYAQVLQKIYQILVKLLPDDTTIIQIDGDKLWAFVIEDLTDAKMQQIHEIINTPLEIEGVPVYIEIVLGYAKLNKEIANASGTKYTYADIACRYAQHNHLPYVKYEEHMLAKRQEFELLGVFKKAMEQNETFMMYQPKVDLRTRKPVGFEALIRWQHPERGLIMPDDFVPFVEKTLLIQQMTDWVLNEVLMKIHEFKEKGIKISISLNISTKNLLSKNFVERVNEVVKRCSIEPKQLEFEITETALMIHPEESKKVLQHLRDSGYQLSIDDFGQAYSSLSYITQLPIHIIKIDRYFISRMASESHVADIVAAVIHLSSKLKTKVVAEGVETEETAKLLEELGCEFAQGYLFARPMFEKDIIEYYMKNK